MAKTDEELDELFESNKINGVKEYTFSIENGADMHWSKKADPKLWYVRRRWPVGNSHKEEFIGSASTYKEASEFLEKEMKKYKNGTYPFTFIERDEV